MPEDVGGSPFPDGWEPDDDRGGADEEFASVVFDEDFVRAATIHEPTAVERLLAAAEARAEASEAEGRRARARGPHPDEEPPEDFFTGGPGGFGAHEFDDGLYDPDVLDDGYGRPRGHRARWHRTVAWMLALVMGVGMVALAFTAVYRGASGGRQDRVPAPASTEVGTDTGPPRMGPPSGTPTATATASPGAR
ncbi:hypothetical protein [Streptomyces sp. NPDC050560]|uniref:SCO2584 family spore wall biosynthesis protein n=1 Tax=Streptomyces sp. NPDC050560 TaxID=3365630 RepID=UPI0037A8B39D